MNNKESSSKQEKMVADYMGWKVVTGSGARPFAPGDVANSQCLVECKTHNTEQRNIVFRKTHWKKISKEARSVNKYPILITDNGAQKSTNTWVMLPRNVLTSKIVNGLLVFLNTSTSGNTITFNQETAYSTFEAFYNNTIINFFEQSWEDEKVAIMPLEEFRKFYQSEFEC